jgi:hypothetical protein
VTLPRTAGLWVFFGVSLALALHLALLAAWHFSIAPELETGPYPEELTRNTIDRFPQPGVDWAQLNANGLHLRAPIVEPAAAAIARCSRRCQIDLHAGKLTIFAEALGKPYAEQINALSPTRDDIGLLRTPRHNWRVISQLAVHTTMPNPMPLTERFTGPDSRGVVTYFKSNDIERWVIYAYSAHGLGSQKLAVSGASREVLLALLGSLRFAEGL